MHTTNRNWFVSFDLVVSGISPISSLLVGELFPLEYRGIGSSIATSFSYFCAFISVKTFIDFQVCVWSINYQLVRSSTRISSLKLLFVLLLLPLLSLYLLDNLGNIGIARCILVVRVYLMLWPIFCCDVCAGNERQRSWWDGSKIRTNYDNKSMRFGNSRRIFSVVVVVVFIVAVAYSFFSNYFTIHYCYYHWQRIKNKKKIMIFFCLTFRCLVRARVSVFIFCCVLEKCKSLQVCIQFSIFNLTHMRGSLYYASTCK